MAIEPKAASSPPAEPEQNFRELTDHLPQLIWAAAADGTCDFFNHRWLEYTGDQAAAHAHRGWLEQLHPDDLQAAGEAWQRARAEQSELNQEFRIRAKDGSYRWFEGRVSPIRDASGRVVRWLGSNTEILDPRRGKQSEEALRRTEAALRAANDSLEHRVRERTAALEAQSEQLRGLALDLAETESRERKRLAQILHDHFQQLISAAKMKIGIIRRRSPDHPELNSLRETENLLEEAMNASRTLATELSPPVLHDTGLNAALEWLARRMQQNHNLAVRLQLDAVREPDNEQVRIILFECVRELLFNVVKHAGVQSAELNAAMLMEGLLQITVIDHGAGFDSQSARITRKPDGSFGLFSIRERMGLIGGLVKVVSAPGKGTRVELTVPMTIQPTHDAVSPQRQPMAMVTAAQVAVNRTVRVLVADDHKLFREGLIALLNQEPYLAMVGEAGDGQEAVELARKLHPDIMIVDVTMPKLNGVQVTSTISKEMPNIKIIGLSMHERDDMAKAMYNAGAVAYCAKNSPIEALVNILRNTAATVEPAEN